MAVMTFNKKIDDWQLSYRQRLPLEVKEEMSMRRIESFIGEYGEDGVYNSFSGGKDSTVQKHLIERVCGTRVKNVYLDTWLEYPSVREFAHSFDNVIVLKPLKSMKEIVRECGWCFPSKEVASMIAGARNENESDLKKLAGLDKNGKPSAYRESFKKWWKLYDSDILISKDCCVWQKEKPVQLFEVEHNMHPIVATMADEGQMRKQAYLRGGCLTFDTTEFLNADGTRDMKKNKRPMCRPLGFWTDQDIFQYLRKYNLDYAREYGEIVEVRKKRGMCSMFPCETKLCCTGEPRTGCCMCPVGCHLDRFAKFKRLRQKYPKLYDYCMEELGEKRLVKWVEENVLSK